jgi:TRAP-type C4-dicarboxylate transport system permease small subunit
LRFPKRSDREDETRMVKKQVKSVVDAMGKGVEVITGVMGFIMMVSLMWQVFTRFVIKIPSIWTEEIARYSFIYMAMIGASIGVKRSTHFGMTMLTDKLQGRARIFYTKYVVNGTILICSIFILVYGWEFAIDYGLTRVSPTFLVPMIWVFLCMPITAVLMIVFSLYNIFFEGFSEEVSPEPESPSQERGDL